MIKEIALELSHLDMSWIANSFYYVLTNALNFLSLKDL